MWGFHVRKKVFLRTSLSSIIMYIVASIVVLAVIAFTINSIIFLTINWGTLSFNKQTFAYFGSIIILPFLIYYFLALFSGHNYVTNDSLCNSGEFPYSGKMQYKTKVLFSNIKMIELIYSQKNSKMKWPKGIVSGPRQYLVVYDYNGKKHCFSVSGYSKKTLVKFLTTIKVRCEFLGNHIDININSLVNIYAHPTKKEFDKMDENDEYDENAVE